MTLHQARVATLREKAVTIVLGVFQSVRALTYQNKRRPVIFMLVSLRRRASFFHLKVARGPQPSPAGFGAGERFGQQFVGHFRIEVAEMILSSSQHFTCARAGAKLTIEFTREKTRGEVVNRP